jgi:hypothetical protein
MRFPLLVEAYAGAESPPELARRRSVVLRRRQEPVRPVPALPPLLPPDALLRRLRQRTTIETRARPPLHPLGFSHVDEFDAERQGAVHEHPQRRIGDLPGLKPTDGVEGRAYRLGELLLRGAPPKADVREARDALAAAAGGHMRNLYRARPGPCLAGRRTRSHELTQVLTTQLGRLLLSGPVSAGARRTSTGPTPAFIAPNPALSRRKRPNRSHLFRAPASL